MKMQQQMHKPTQLLQIFLVVGVVLIADAYIQSANAQCSPSDGKVYIDPRLVPPVSHYTPAQMAEIMGNQYADPEMKRMAREMYMRQFNPIEMPYTGGRILINPQNPCIQQFIPN